MATPALARERLFALRETIARLEQADGPSLVRRKRRWQWDAQELPEDTSAPGAPENDGAALDAVFDGGVPASGLVEIRNTQTRDVGAAAGFSLALATLRQDQAEGVGATLWISQALALSEAGLPYGPGLKKHGLDPARFFLARPRIVPDALWMGETALGVSAFSTVIMEIRGNPACFGLTESRRLQMRARANGILLLLLRQAGQEEASNARHRLRVDPAPASERLLPDASGLDGSIGNPVFLVTPEKSKTADPVGILLEWNSHDRRFCRLDPRPAAVEPERRTEDSLPVVSLSPRRSHSAEALGAVVAYKGAS